MDGFYILVSKLIICITLLIAGQSIHAKGQDLKKNPRPISLWQQRIYRIQHLQVQTIAEILWLQKNIVKNEKLIKKKIEVLLPRSAARHYFQAVLEWQKGNDTDSLKKIDQSLKINNTYSFSWALRSVILNRLGKTRLAIENIKRAIQLNPYEANYILTLASYYAHLGNYSQAINYCDRALKIRENFASAYIIKGKIYSQKKQIKLADLNYAQARKFGATEKDIKKGE